MVLVTNTLMLKLVFNTMIGASHLGKKINLANIELSLYRYIGYIERINLSFLHPFKKMI